MGSIIYVNALIGLILVIITLVKSYKRHTVIVRVYLLGIALLFVSIGFSFAAALGVVAVHVLPVLRVGMVAELVILSFVVGLRFRQVKNRMVELEKQSLSAQINPHFIFNSLASIQGLITDKKSEEAQIYLVKFSRLVRMALNQSTMNLVPIVEEVELINNYVQLEQMRFPDSFDFSFDIDDEIDKEEIKIPRMIIQPFIENAIQHGILQMKRKGRIMVKVKKLNKGYLQISIRDNGVGRADTRKSASKLNYKSMGLGLVQERISLIHPSNEVRIIDITPEKEGGTKVILTLKIID